MKLIKNHYKNRFIKKATSSALVPFLVIGAGTVIAADQVNQNYIIENAKTGKDWPTHGFDYAETRFSPLSQISADNVEKLGLAWSYNLGSERGVEATPLVVDGVMYVTASWSIVHALDAKTGKKLWTYDPEVPGEAGSRGCCDVVNRGVAVHFGNVYVASYDGRLIALDAKTGEKVWETNTLPDNDMSYTITGAPRVVNGNVIIGNGGAEFGVRGYITAYDAKTGAQKWRWYTVPGNPNEPFENEAMARAAKTWDPSGKYWEAGGGGTVWDSIVFDPDLNLLYIGTGNGSPWSHKKRSPEGGDNLYLSSIVALNADTGEYVWHYQATPGDNWDYTSTQDMILSELMIDGERRKVIMQAPKNGFFFVLDRTNGEFISADNYVDVNWATGYDSNGRPIEVPEARSMDEPFDIIPGPFGGHNWHSMSFNHQTGLAYFPTQHIPITMVEDPSWESIESNEPGQPMSGVGWNTAFKFNVAAPSSKPFGRLTAWDPVTQQEAWRYEHVSPWNGGTLTTAGNLVFQGTADARFMAFNARTGDLLWESPMGTGVIAAPITYEVDGTQYVSIAAGWGGVFGQSQRASDLKTAGTVYTFVLNGDAEMPEFTQYQLNSLVSGVEYNPDFIGEGTALYVSNCVFCHGVPGVDKGGNIPNLGYSKKSVIENLDAFLFHGPFVSSGMPDFTETLNETDVEKIKAFIQGTADAIRPKSQ
ncbi:PQQ-dependent dehydrogenase, methanol/ethanol family [Marinobacter nauticus]|jgi:quinohemoprotein ethanol dehydrogenase|uniref:PQQ-dependent dehydrogenase, methanol/ethanol family n=1 Tax=Marinobacter nauticus TaxID=2743 RepID=UPI001C96F868|nr:PQQ-dependent dehydrogenase, methanol/ethanol family [Marinobacter nauticus]MBY5938111.1 PQQ-dependent dehydrogenase, methanol/ethanol family [Marinobacter nauticus]MBY5955340.1 PQQ-dependent dehydrogenase, methanol/ethanol family [Marinobacter nauticus]MBY6009131.1 PQQ-dependent dehydrogenase, methanol/ethanol family [Marinobacter nauticus]MBY6102436.1 PQQ-dependent dehydrogenase, methanol/ethanol family [Marinobacter nauticus]